MMARCANCGGEVSAGERFCRACGAPVSAPVAAGMHCTSCGAALAPGDTFCPVCGARQGAAAQPVAPPPQQWVPPQPVQQAPPQWAPPQPVAPQWAPPPPAQQAWPAPAPGYYPAGPAIQYKGVWSRFFAAFLDGILYFILGAVVAAVTGGGSTSGASAGYDLSNNQSNVLNLIFFGYYILFEGFFGATIGKMILNIRVVNKEGNAPGLIGAFLRNLFRIIDFLPLFYILGIILIAGSAEKRRLGDRVGGTYVVSRGSAAMMRASSQMMRGAPRAY